MFAFVAAQHGLDTGSTHASLPRKRRHGIQQFGYKDFQKLNQRPQTLFQVTLAEQFQQEIPKWRQDLEAKLRTIEDSTEEQGSESSNDGGDLLSNSAIGSHGQHDKNESCTRDTYTSKWHLKLRRVSAPVKSSPREVPLTETRKSSLPLFSTLKRPTSPALVFFQGKMLLHQ